MYIKNQYKIKEAYRLEQIYIQEKKIKDYICTREKCSCWSNNIDVHIFRSKWDLIASPKCTTCNTFLPTHRIVFLLNGKDYPFTLDYKEEMDCMSEIIKSCQSKRDFEELLNCCNTLEQRDKVKRRMNLMTQIKETGEYSDVRDKMETIDLKQYIAEEWWVKFNRNSCSCKLPWHNDWSPSFHIYPNTNTFYCFWCSRWWSLIDFLIHNDNMSKKDAITFINWM